VQDITLKEGKSSKANIFSFNGFEYKRCGLVSQGDFDDKIWKMRIIIGFGVNL